MDIIIDNLLWGEKNELKNRFLHVKYAEMFPVNADKLRANAGVNAGVNHKNAGVKLSSVQIEIVEIIKINAQISQKEIAEKLNKDETTIYRNIRKIKSLGILSREGADKNGYWKINEKEVNNE
ncbi:hypothetical protein AGMMS49982_20440 [Bacteroidia bacterium]|nr:hypothetical protein AGMMS49982_20440 [Bacteroidia bacterium]